MELPKTKTLARTDLSEFTVMIYGPTKIGKSTFASRFPEALFLACEPGLNALDAYQIPITSWAELLAAAAEIAKGGHNFKTVVIDTADLAYKYCEDYVCGQEQIRHPNDLEYGKGAAFVNNEFQRVLTKLASLPYGLVLISHDKEREVKTQTGKYMKITPSLTGGAYKIILAMADMVLYCDTEEIPSTDGKVVTRRVIHTKPTMLFDAGDRTGRLPEVLPLSYQEFVKAFQSATKKAA